MCLFILFIMRVSSAYISTCTKIEYMCGFIMILPNLMIINLVFMKQTLLANGYYEYMCCTVKQDLVHET